VRLALWTPCPDAAWVAALLPLLQREAAVEVVAREPGRAPEVEVDLYHVADDPAHVFVHRALCRRPGLVLLADWGLHRLARAATEGDAAAYLAEARRAHGERGTFVARQVQRGLGSEVLASLLTLNDRVLEASLGLVAFTGVIRARSATRLPGRPVAHLPLDFVGRTEALPGRDAARAALGVGVDEALVASLTLQGARALERAGARVRARVWPWPEREDEALALLAAADVAVALEHPARGGLPPPLVSAIVAGLPTLVSAGTGAAAEMEDGVVVKVSPGPTETEEVVALLRRLLDDAALRRRVGALAGGHARARRDPAPAAEALLALAREVSGASAEALGAFAADRAEEGTLLAWALEEVRWGARDLGLVGLPLGLEPLVGPLLGRAG
jgi:glycosyltransferase involved in cell wall biosynthesis